MTNFEQIQEFMVKFGHHVADTPTLDVPPEVTKLWLKLIKEERKELIDAIEAGNLIEVADGVADLLYVVYGFAAAHGLPADKLFDEIHRSNMTKLGADGKPIIRKDGKRLKGPNYEKPQIQRVLFG